MSICEQVNRQGLSTPEQILSGKKKRVTASQGKTSFPTPLLNFSARGWESVKFPEAKHKEPGASGGTYKFKGLAKQATGNSEQETGSERHAFVGEGSCLTAGSANVRRSWTEQTETDP